MFESRGIKWDILKGFGSYMFVVDAFSQHINNSIAQLHNICCIHSNEPWSVIVAAVVCQ